MSRSALRRAIHASTALPLLLAPDGAWNSIRVWLAIATAAGVAVEVFRLRTPSLHRWMARVVPVFMRDESRRPSGAFWLLVGYTMASWVPSPGPTAGIACGALADPAASWVGGRLGGGSRKSWPGTLAALAAAAAILWFLNLSIPAILVGSVAAAALERWSGWVDDNLVVAPGVALVVWALA